MNDEVSPVVSHLTDLSNLNSSPKCPGSLLRRHIVEEISPNPSFSEPRQIDPQSRGSLSLGIGTVYSSESPPGKDFHCSSFTYLWTSYIVPCFPHEVRPYTLSKSFYCLTKQIWTSPMVSVYNSDRYRCRQSKIFQGYTGFSFTASIATNKCLCMFREKKCSANSGCNPLGGPTRSSVEVSVMGMERRGWIICPYFLVNQ